MRGTAKRIALLLKSNTTRNTATYLYLSLLNEVDDCIVAVEEKSAPETSR